MKSTDLICPKCNEMNNLPEGKATMFCAHCGNSIGGNNIEKQKGRNTNPLKSKPQITKRITETSEETSEDEMYVTYPIRKRVAGGWEVWEETYSGNGRTIFLPDVTESTEVIINEGGELGLSNKGISSFEQISCWYTDRELKEIKVLNLENNNISSWDGLEMFPNLKSLNLNGNRLTSWVGLTRIRGFKTLMVNDNEITYLPPPLFSKKFEKIYLLGNPIKIKEGLAGNIILEDFSCSLCSKSLTQDEAIAYNIENKNHCLKCYKQYQAEKYTRENPPKSIQTNPQNNPIDSRKTSPCFIATATMGDSEHPLVIELREFRDNWIAKKWWGNVFINLYYRTGKFPAALIERSSVLRKLSLYFIVTPISKIAKQKTKKNLY